MIAEPHSETHPPMRESPHPRKSISPSVTLILVLCSCVALTAIASHLVCNYLRIRVGAVGYKLLAKGNQRPFALAEGSSLMLDGLSWNRISNAFGQGIENWFVAGSSPCEWEPLQHRSSNARLTFIVVSAYDLNEYFLCDYRAEVVSLNQSIKTLWKSGADWAFSKRTLSQYPLQYLRFLFPTLGRSDGVMVGTRERLGELLRPWLKIKSETGPAIGAGSDTVGEEVKTGRLTEWSEARILRRLALMRSACLGKHTFNGPKKLAFLRMLQRAQQQGNIIVVVLPVFPAYAKEFLSPETTRQFEDALSDVEGRVPQANWVHLEKLPTLHSDNYFWDLVHMNADGQQIATDEFLRQIHTKGILVK